MKWVIKKDRVEVENNK